MKKIIFFVGAVVVSIIVFVLIGQKEEEPTSTNEIPVIYHHEYNITLGGIEKFHPFDSAKYGKVFEKLSSHFSISYDQVFHPVEITEKELLTVHSPEYLESLKSNKTIEKIVEIPGISWLPNSMLDKNLLYPMRLATGGSVLAVKTALKFGWAVNLSGGYHHAKKESGDGFCVYGDIALASREFFKNNKSGRILIIDLDAHQGNGHESMLGDDPRIVIMDIYNHNIYPGDEDAAQNIDYSGAVDENMKDREYLELVDSILQKALKENEIDFIIYNAGTDIYEKDPLGGFKISREGIIKRDEIVFTIAKEKEIPIIMLLSGGYTQESGNIIGDSLINVMENVFYNL